MTTTNFDAWWTRGKKTPESEDLTEAEFTELQAVAAQSAGTWWDITLTVAAKAREIERRRANEKLSRASTALRESQNQRDEYSTRAMLLSIALIYAEKIIPFAAHRQRCDYYPSDWDGDGGTPCTCGLQPALNQFEKAKKDLAK